ncbi:MAG: hypothetical protein ACRDLM_06295 [Gaiellaceae bacterium]
MNRTIVKLCALGASSLAATVALFVAPASATQPAGSQYGVVNATVNAATDHEILGSTAFPNYVTGAIDNYYTMAHSHVDNSPFAEGTSSPADTGPLGQTAAAGNFAQPQYADARWPGKDSGKATFGNQGGPFAAANAVSYKATAESSEASSASSSSSGSGSATKIVAPKGFAKRLRVALAAWKARWLAPLGLKKIKGVSISLTLPTVPTATVSTPAVTTPGVTTPKVTTPTVTTPKVTPPGSKSKSGSGSSSSGSGGGVLESSSVAQLDPKSGAIVTSGQSSLSSVNLGGQIVLDGINVSVTVTNSGKPTDKIAVNVADASIGGVPVTINQDGVQVQGQGQNLPFQQADDALNSALKQAGVQLFTVVPEVKKSTNEEAVTASGVHVLFTQPVDQSGVPAQYAEHILGEVFVDSLAAPAGPVPKLKLSGFVVGGGTTGVAGSSGLGTSGTSGSASSTYGGSSPTSGTTGTAASQAAPTSFTSLLSKPAWLLIAYLVWQAMVIGTGASLWRWRLGGA